jgi:mannose-6-phosphate isomerase-like protein (cupin superfamily)
MGDLVAPRFLPQTVLVTDFATMRLPAEPTVVAPDGSDVRVLLGLPAGSMAHFELAAGKVARAVAHRTVEEVWFVVAGRGEMWRKQGEREETVLLEPGVCLTIPLGTHFQFRASDAERLAAVAITMPPWPGEGEAFFVRGPWEATVDAMSDLQQPEFRN